MHSITGIGDYRKASKLVHTPLLLCKSQPDQVNICNDQSTTTDIN